MVGNMYKVTVDYDPPESNRGEFLKAEKGDILIDCKSIDEYWFHGKNMMNDKNGKIPIEYIEPFSSNEEEEEGEEEEESNNTTYEDIDVDFSSQESSALLKKQDTSSITASITPNPLLSAVDERDHSDIREGNLSKYHEPEYVEMSSGETINEEQPALVDSTTSDPSKGKGPPPKPCRSIQEPTKPTDDGYNSGSHYSGENTESNVPLLAKPIMHKQDEAGYEVPHLVCDFSDHQDNKNTLGEKPSKGNKKLKNKFSFRKLIGRNTDQKDTRRVSCQDESREKYYNPPIDQRDNYFLPQSNYPEVRLLFSFIAALGASLGLFLVLHIVGEVHAVLCFSLAAIIFIIVMVCPVTLLNRGTFCVTALLLPNLVSSRAKIGIIIILFVMFICGPILGTVDKINFATKCEKFVSDVDTYEPNDKMSIPPRFRKAARRYRMQRECFTSFDRVNEFCSKVYETFNRNCKRYEEKDLSTEELKLCNKNKYEFCSNKTELQYACRLSTIKSTSRTFLTSSLVNSSKGAGVKDSVYDDNGTESARKVLLYLLPLLFILILSAAYSYNRLFLCTKNEDNIYITHRLREVDCERKNRGLNDLIFPLTRIEFHTYLLRRTFAWSKSEKESVFKWFMVLIFLILVTVGLVALEDNINRILLLSLSTTCKQIHEIESKNEHRALIYFLLGVLLFVLFVQSHVLRAQSVICEYFYPDMIDIRSKHLYYKILHDRHTFARHIRRKVHLISEEKRLTRRISFKTKTYEILPLRLKWVCSKLTVRRCMICYSISYRKTVECKEQSCMAHYCYECYVDAGQHCLTCKSSNDTRVVSVAI